MNQVRKHGRGGGICVFIHNSLAFKLSSDLGTNRNDIESLAIEIINKETKILSLVHSSNNQLVMLNKMKHFLKIYLIKSKILIRQNMQQTTQIFRNSYFIKKLFPS